MLYTREIEVVTKELKDQLATPSRFKHWLGTPVGGLETMTDLDHYQGDFKRSLEFDCGAVH